MKPCQVISNTYVDHWGYKFQVWSDLTFTFVLPPGHIIMQQSCWQLALSSGSDLPYPRCWKTPGTVVSAEVAQYPDLKIATSSCSWMTTVVKSSLAIISSQRLTSNFMSCPAEYRSQLGQELTLLRRRMASPPQTSDKKRTVLPTDTEMPIGYF